MVVAAILAAALLTPSRAAAIPANDDFDHAAPVGGPPAEVTGTTEGATQQPGESTATALMSVWYAFRPAVAQRVGIEAYRLDESSHPSLLTDKNLVLSVSTGSGLGSLHELGSDDIWDPRVEFDAAAGATYWVRVASNFAERFALRATTTTAPPNDFFSAAQRVKVGVEYSGSFADATTELGEPDVANHPHSVWFRFRAPHDERITVDSGGSLARNGLVAYTGSDISRLHRVATGVGSSPTGGMGDVVRFQAKRGHVYSIALGDQSPHSGEYKLWISDGGVKGKGLAVDVAPGQSLASVLGRGLSAVVHAKRLVKVRLELVVSRALARRLGLRTPVLGDVAGRVDYGQDLAASIGLTSAARKALRGRKGLSATLRVVILDRRAPNRTLTKRIALSR
jgi:hypothetical protein